MLLRIDNIFFTAPDVAALSAEYGRILGLQVRRSQVQQPGLMWAEIALGGMEMSFRKAEATTKVHPRPSTDFLEAPVGHGVTISFEVQDTDATIAELTSRGVKFFGEPLSCTSGMEIVSIFQDNAGRPVQLYEPRFKTAKALQPASAQLAQLVDMRANDLAASFEPPQSSPTWNEARAGIAGTSIPGPQLFGVSDTHPWGFMSRNRVLVGSNLRDGRNLAYSVAFYEPNLKGARQFYGDVLGLPISFDSKDLVQFDVDGAVIEFRSPPADEGFFASRRLASPRYAGIPMIEVRSLDAAVERLTALGLAIRPSPQRPRKVETLKRAAFNDSLGNVFEVWERGLAPLVAEAPNQRKTAELEHWDLATA